MRHLRPLRPLFALALIPLASCGGPQLLVQAPPRLAKGSSAIVGGTNDSGDPAVAVLYNGTQGYLCSGTIIAPGVYLTAGHCTQPDTTAAHYQIAGGLTPFQGATWVTTATEVHTNPGYNPSQIGVADTGILLFSASAATGVTPMAWQSSRNDALYQVGTQFRAVGYGIIQQGGTTDTSGTKRQVTLSITQSATDAFQYGSSTQNTCEGDSGGPAIENVGGTDTVIGTVSYGDQNCAQFGVDMRTDDEAAFISQYANAASTPTPTPSGTPTPGGTPTPSPTGTPGGSNDSPDNDDLGIAPVADAVGCSVGGSAGSPVALIALAGLALVTRRRR